MFAPRDVFVVSRMGMHFDILSTISRVGSERCALWCYRSDRTLYALLLIWPLGASIVWFIRLYRFIELYFLLLTTLAKQSPKQSFFTYCNIFLQSVLSFMRFNASLLRLYCVQITICLSSRLLVLFSHFPSNMFLLLFKRVTRCLLLRWKHLSLIQRNGKNRK